MPAPDFDEVRNRRRLDSWKEIAAWLGRDVRTAKRWEKSEDLPVRRHNHKRLASVYAFEDELEAWREERQERPSQRLVPQTSEPAVAERRPRSVTWRAVILAALVAVIVAGGTMYRRHTPPALPFQERDWALIAHFENRTGEPIFDRSVEYALERELVNSQFINIVPRERLLDALALMMLPPDTVIDRHIGREICLRDGGIRALISGRVEKLGWTYVFSADLVDPSTGIVVRSFSERSDDERQVAGAISRLAEHVRSGLGEELSTRSAAQRSALAPGSSLERVSTPSLRALQLYSHADGLIREHNLEQATAVLRETVRLDAGFASAHVLLAHVLASLGRESESRSHLITALELAEKTTHRERLFIEATFHEKLGEDAKKAIETLETLIRLYPDHYWAHSNLSVVYESRSEPLRALPHTIKRADLRPHNFDHQLRAAHALALSGDLAAAERYAERARRLIAEERDDPMRAWRAAWVRLYPAQTKWLQGQLDDALAEVDRIAAEIETTAPAARAPLQWEVGSFYLNLGRARAAQRVLGGMAGAPDNLALVALGTGDENMSQQLQIAPASHRSAILLARMGLLSEAERALAHPGRLRRVYAPFLPAAWELLAQGEVATARGNPSEAIPLLRRATSLLGAWPTPYYFLGIEALSRSLAAGGDLESSVGVLEDAAHRGRSSVFWGPGTLFWMKNELRRAEVYRLSGREAEAREVETRLLDLLRLADEDFEILEELRRRRTAS